MGGEETWGVVMGLWSRDFGGDSNRERFVDRGVGLVDRGCSSW